MSYEKIKFTHHPYKYYRDEIYRLGKEITQMHPYSRLTIDIIHRNMCFRMHTLSIYEYK
jgi:hypothetical protein